MRMIEKIFRYVRENGSTNFTDNFFGIKPTQKDFERFEKFKETLTLKFVDKLTIEEISKRVGKSRDTISLWIRLEQLPFMVQMLKIYLILGDPKPGWKWLPVNIGFGQTLDGPWIQVPMTIQKFDDVMDVINQLQSLPNSIEKVKNFFDNDDENLLKLEIFAYLLGFVVGDLGKKKNKRICTRISSRSFSLKLTNRIHKNLLLGNFVINCIGAMGLRSKRLKDQVDKSTNAARFYWESQYSILIEWIFRICLGLKEDETTTFNPVRMGWLFSTPQIFKVRFIQGLGDSDGYINMLADCCNIASYPNTNFIKYLIEQLGIKTRIDKMLDGPVVAMTPKEAIKLPLFFPNENISHRYHDLKAYVNARHKKAGRGTPKFIIGLIKNYSKKGKKKAEIMKILAHRHRYVVSYGTLSRYHIPR